MLTTATVWESESSQSCQESPELPVSFFPAVLELAFGVEYVAEQVAGRRVCVCVSGPELGSDWEGYLKEGMSC